MDNSQSFLIQNPSMIPNSMNSNINNILIPDNQPYQQQMIPQNNPYNQQDSSMKSITDELNNSGNPPLKQEDINKILDKPDSFDEPIKEEPPKFKKYLIKFIIILAVYLIFSIDSVKRLFSTIIINLYPSNNYLSIVGLIVYGAVLSAVCIGVEYKLGY